MAAELQAQTTTAPASLDDAPIQQSDFKERFYRFFQEEVLTITEQTNRLETVAFAGGERQDAIDHILAAISRLSSEVAQAAGFLPAYDQRTYAQVIKALSEQLQEKRDKIAPRPKFSFKTSHKNSSAISLNDAVEIAQNRFKALSTGSSNVSSAVPTPSMPSTPSAEAIEAVSNRLGHDDTARDYNEEIAAPPSNLGQMRKPSFSTAKMITIAGHKGLHIMLPSSAAQATSSGSLTKLSNCVVDMSVPTSKKGSAFAGLALKDIKNSLIIAGHVAGPAHITGVKNSVLVVAARQVRIHDCQDVDIYLQCASRPIIEDCKDVRFAPIPDMHAFRSEKPIDDLWDQVDDFKWLKAEHSPNWSILPPESRVAEEVWRDVVPGGPSTNVDDILQAVGIQCKSKAST